MNPHLEEAKMFEQRPLNSVMAGLDPAIQAQKLQLNAMTPCLDARIKSAHDSQ